MMHASKALVIFIALSLSTYESLRYSPRRGDSNRRLRSNDADSFRKTDRYKHIKDSSQSLVDRASLAEVTKMPPSNENNLESIETTSFQIEKIDKTQMLPGQMSEWNARLLLLFVSALYGTNFGCVKILGQSLEPSVAASLRFFLSFLVFSPWLLPNLIKKSSVVLAGLEVGSYITAGYLVQAVALQTTHASTAAFLCALAVVVVPLLDLFAHNVFGNKNNKAFQTTDSSTNSGNAIPSPYFALFPALLAATGVGFLELAGDDIPGVGDLLALGQPLFFGLAFWRGEKLTRSFYGSDDTKIYTGASMAAVSLGSLCWAYVDYLRPLLAQGSEVAMQSLHAHMALFSDWQIPAALFWTGVVTTALTIYVENIAMKTLSAAESTVIYSTEPLWGTAFAALALGEQIGGNVVVGAILILASCVSSGLGPAATTAGILSAAEMVLNMPEVFDKIAQNWGELLRSFEELFLWTDMF